MQVGSLVKNNPNWKESADFFQGSWKYVVLAVILVILGNMGCFRKRVAAVIGGRILKRVVRHVNVERQSYFSEAHA